MLYRLRSNESGMALLTVLLAMGLLTALGAALTAVGIVEFRAAKNHRSASRALLLADAGATHALALMRGPLAGYSYTDVLVGADGVEDTEDDGVFTGFALAGDDALPDTGILPTTRTRVAILMTTTTIASSRSAVARCPMAVWRKCGSCWPPPTSRP